MAFDFDSVFKTALQAGAAAAHAGGKAAEDWIRETAQANRDALKAIADGVLKGKISQETAEILLNERRKVLDGEAAALDAIVTAAAQAAVNAFLGSLFSAFKSALKLAL